jgi:hypothetical protein
MLAQEDKRADERFASRSTIIFSLFSTRFWHEYPSVTCNHSKDGMCFETNHPLTPGADLFIRTAYPPNLDSDVDQALGLRNSTLARVKWCRQLPDEERTSYWVGVKYY